MKICYVDSSVIVGILFCEKESPAWIRYINSCDEVISANLTEAEVLSAATRESISLDSAKSLLDAISLIQPDRTLRKEYERIFSSGYCRGADAFHIACALYLDPEAKEIIFFTVDKQQEKVAKSVGFSTKN